jgi:hypothetical protein
MAQDRELWQILVNMVMNFQVEYNVGYSSVAKWLVASQGLSSMELVKVPKGSLLWSHMLIMGLYPKLNRLSKNAQKLFLLKYILIASVHPH